MRPSDGMERFVLFQRPRIDLFKELKMDGQTLRLPRVATECRIDDGRVTVSFAGSVVAFRPASDKER